MTSTLHIHLLGDFLLFLDNEPVTTVDWPRMQSMLAYLILHRDAPRSRTHLAFLFWPDSTEEQAHTNLRHLVYRLRRTLPNANSYLHANKQTLHWNPDVPWTLDVAVFERAIAEADQAEQDGNLISMRVALEEAVKLSSSSTISLAMLGQAYGAAGRKRDMEEIRDKLLERSKHQYVPSYWIALLYVGVGDKDQAFHWLERAFQERSSWLVWAGVEPRFDILRSDNRFSSILARMKLGMGKQRELGLRGWIKGPSK